MAYHHYSDEEKFDADEVDRADRLLREGDVAAARSVLEAVIANAPEFYVYNFGNEKELFIKFWSLDEYLGYITLTRKKGAPVTQEIIWLKSAYPRAYYRLAEMELATGNDPMAAEFLDHALQMEPEQPLCLLRMAEIFARSGDVKRAIEHFDLTLGARPYMPSTTIAAALAGKARQLVNVKDFAGAEKCLEESLRHKPDNPLALNVQRYAESMRDGSVTSPVEVDGIDTNEIEEAFADESEAESAPPPTSPEGDEPKSDKADRPWWKLW